MLARCFCRLPEVRYDRSQSSATSERVSQTHAKKFNQLLSNMKRGRSPPAVDKEKWVVNVSQRTLSPVEITALEKGFNFSIAPKKIPVAKILSSVENGFFSLNQSTKDRQKIMAHNIALVSSRSLQRTGDFRVLPVALNMLSQTVKLKERCKPSKVF